MTDLIFWKYFLPLGEFTDKLYLQDSKLNECGLGSSAASKLSQTDNEKVCVSGKKQKNREKETSKFMCMNQIT